MNNYCNRLIEVDLPIRKISEHSRREKSIRHGHISTLHIWWARRPLAACRAVILASLLPDPADPQCPEEFRKKAIEVIKQIRGGNLEDPLVLRKVLLDFIAEFSAWEMSTNQVYLSIARELVQSAHTAFGGEPGTRPLVVDPFAGGGSIPLEALRVGADTFAMDYNPVAVLILKVLLEYIPKYGHKLAEEVKKWGAWIKKEAEKALSEFYPKDTDGSTPIAYIWARTIKCEGPACGAEVPLMRSLWLAKKGKNSVALKMTPNKKEKRVDFEIIKGDLKEKDVQSGTVKRGSATCPVCGYTTPVTRVREQATTIGLTPRMIVKILTKQNVRRKIYRLASNSDFGILSRSILNLDRLRRSFSKDKSPIPNEKVNTKAHSVNRLPMYGLFTWGDLFNSRQLIAFLKHMEVVKKLNIKPKELNEALKVIFALALDRMLDHNSSICIWNVLTENEAHTFARQAIPMTMDFVETNPVYGPANYNCYSEIWFPKIVHELNIKNIGTTQRGSAIAIPLPDDAADIYFSDPPYYDSVSYGDLSDFFYVWLKRTISDLFPDLFESYLTNKKEEIIVEPTEVEGVGIKTKEFYESMMIKAFEEKKRILKNSGLGVLVFAHKSTSGWEAFVQSIIDSGHIVTASWPIDTERQGKVSGINQARLASSIHLVCRPRPENAEVGDWREVLSQLQPRIHEWMPRLSQEGIVGADAIFSCLGPALEIFSRYERVETASGKKVELKEYLEHIWSAVAKEALNMIFAGADLPDATLAAQAGASGFEEDSRLTALWLWTLHSGQWSVVSGQNQLSVNSEQWSEEEEELNTDHSSLTTKKPTGFFLEYDAARKIAQGLGAHLEVLGQPGGIVEVKGDKARLVSVSERWRALFGKDKEIRTRRKKEYEQLTLSSDQWTVDSEQSEIEELKTGKTVLDRLHQAMLLFADGRSSALRRFIVDESVGNDDRFWRLAQSLSALYPAHTDEKRWIDGILARKKSFGF